MGKAELTPPD